MRLVVCAVALLFCLFPYTQIIELDSYTQPYALIFSTLAAGVSYSLLFERFPRGDMAVLLALAATGIVFFLLTCLPNPDSQEFKYLLIYVSPVIFAAASFSMVTLSPSITDRILVFAALTWMAVGFVQAFFDPAFASQFVGDFGDSAEAVIESGRGVLGLAPEPTHFGFHMILMAAALALVGGRNLLSLACLATAIVVARSSSAMLALALGGLIYITLFTRRARLLLLAVIPAYALLGAALNSGMLPGDVRAVALLRDLYEDPWYLFTSDGSANSRLGGIYVGAKEIVNNAFLPAGMSHETWQSSIGSIMSHNSWLLLLSDSGIPSGILIIIYQTGFIGLLLLIVILRRMLKGLFSEYETLLMCAVVFVFMSQYMISTPGFGVILGFVLARHQRLGEPWRSPSPASFGWGRGAALAPAE